jgi:Choline/Carnitine o-acyltransferase
MIHSRHMHTHTHTHTHTHDVHTHIYTHTMYTHTHTHTRCTHTHTHTHKHTHIRMHTNTHAHKRMQAAMTKQFRHGRTETIRSLSPQMVDFVSAMESAVLPIQKKQSAIRRAAERWRALPSLLRVFCVSPPILLTSLFTYLPVSVTLCVASTLLFLILSG